MTEAKQSTLLTLEKCGCCHDNVFWVVYCDEHQAELDKIREHWSKLIKKAKAPSRSLKLKGSR